MSWENSIFIYGYLPSSEYLSKAASRQIILVMLLLCYHLWFQIDFACPCTSNRNFIHCYGYMVLPSLIIISLILWNDIRIGRIFRFACYHSSVKQRRCTGKFCFEFFIYFLQAAASGFLWCGSVLVDGDWYVCCGAGNSEELITLSCMKESDIGPVEKARKVKMKNQSMVFGLICILMTAVCSFILVLPWSKWCIKRNHFRAMFEEAILEQTEVILIKEIGKAAADCVSKSLASLSSPTTAPSENNASERGETTEGNVVKTEKVEKSEKDKILINLNVNWDEIACLADVLIESIPNTYHNNLNNTV